jgi:NADH:ubiquinone oxidoreductase subunit 6 (subunit J)
MIYSRGRCLIPSVEGAIMMATAFEVLQTLCAVMFIGVALVATLFWVWMLVDCATKEPREGSEKLVWVIIIVLTYWIGAAIYYLVRRPRRLAESGR